MTREINIIKEIRTKFLEEVSKKNSWGKNEIKEKFNEIFLEITVDRLEELENKK